MTFTRVWRFRPAPGAEREFEAAYGPDGPWVTLFRSGAGYIGTELRAMNDGSGGWLTIDRWESRAHWEAFRSAHADAYEALDRQCEPLTADEEMLEEIEVADGRRAGFIADQASGEDS